MSDAGEAAVPVDADALYSRREAFGHEVPVGGSLLTAGVDVQDDLVECEVVAWGRHEESWSIQYSVIYGDPTTPDPRNDLDRLLLRAYRHERGFELHVSAACVDTGYHSAEAQKFCRPRLDRKIWPIKGVSGFSKPIFPRRASKHSSRSLLFLAGVDSAKEKVYNRLRIDAPGPGFCHFPISHSHAHEYFTQLCSERITVKHTNGFPVRWVKSPVARNEALDCRVYALTALHALYQHGFSLEQHCQQFELMCSPSGAERPTPAGYEVIRSRWMS